MLALLLCLLSMGDTMGNEHAWLTERPVAHRGLHSGEAVPENSLAAFRAAIEAGHPFEFDVHLLTDGTVAVFHDEDLTRLTGRPGKIADLTAPELRLLRLYDTDEHVPTLDELLRFVAGRVPLLIEIKTKRRDVGALEQAVVEALAGYRGPFAVQSFNPHSVAWFRKHAPQIRRGLLLLADRGEDPAGRVGFFLRRVAQLVGTAPHFLGLDVREVPYWPLRLARAFRIPVLGWTVRSEELRERARPWVDNIIFESVDPR